MACNLAAVAVTLEEITDQNREAVLALRVAPGQGRFVSSVEDSLAAAADYPQANPWCRAVFACDEPAGPVGFVMASWNCPIVRDESNGDCSSPARRARKPGVSVPVTQAS